MRCYARLLANTVRREPWLTPPGIYTSGFKIEIEAHSCREQLAARWAPKRPPRHSESRPHRSASGHRLISGQSGTESRGERGSMDSERVRIYMFEGSNSCLTSTLMLEHKQIEYRRVDLPPAAHAILIRFRGFARTTVPAMILDGERVQGTLDISEALDRAFPQPPCSHRVPSIAQGSARRKSGARSSREPRGGSSTGRQPRPWCLLDLLQRGELSAAAWLLVRATTPLIIRNWPARGTEVPTNAFAHGPRASPGRTRSHRRVAGRRHAGRRAAETRRTTRSHRTSARCCGVRRSPTPAGGRPSADGRDVWFRSTGPGRSGTAVGVAGKTVG